MSNRQILDDVIETMNDITRLESFSDFKQADTAKAYLVENHMPWLIQQAETVNEYEHVVDRLEEDIREISANSEELSSKLVKLEDENKEYRQVIENIRCYMETDAIMLLKDEERLEQISGILLEYYEERSEQDEG